MSKWYSFEELKRARTPMLLDSETGLPDNHVITVVEREISVDDSELIQNNVRTDTFTLNLDAEYDDLNVVVIFTKPNNINVKVAYNGTPTHIPGSAMELVGSLACSVVGIDADGEVRAVTKAAPDTFQVVKSGAYDGSVTSDDAELLGQILQAVSDAETATTAATNATSQATSAATSANQAASSANTAASSANSAATKANSAAVDAQNAYDTLAPYMATIDSCANILHREVGPDAVVTADDSFPCKPVELTVYGNTVQNLWVNTGRTHFGITTTVNADGSLTISGTATQDLYIANESNRSYALKPSTQYTLSVDKSTGAEGTGFYIEQRNSENSKVDWSSMYDPAKSVTFTTSANMSYCLMGLYVKSGTTVSGTYRVMLNEGSEAQPWCPPGLNSVGDGGSVEVVTTGKNLYGGNSEISSTSYVQFSVYQWLSELFVSRKVRVSFDLLTENGGTWYIYAYQSSGLSITFDPSGIELSYRMPFQTDSGSVAHFSATGTVFYNPVDGMSPGQIMVYKNGSERGSVSVSNIQIEFGEEETGYEPPNITTTSIDLQGHTLNALPDGTRDELHIDGGGNVVLEKRTWSDVFDGTENWQDVTVRYGLNNGATFAPTPEPLNKQIADTLPAVPTVSGRNGIVAHPSKWVDASIASMLGDLAGFKAWLGNNNTTLIYKLAEPQTIDLGTITPPTMAAPNVTAYVADDTPAEIELDYVRDINIVVDRLEKKVADLVVTEATYV